MKKILFIICFAFGVLVNAQDIVGEWETFDERSGNKSSIIEIYKEGDTYFGKVTELFLDSNNSVCQLCTGDMQGAPIIGLVILEGFKKEGDTYKKGTIVDPNNGESYQCYLKLVAGDKLKVRGYIGFSLLGRTDYWTRKKG